MIGSGEQLPFRVWFDGTPAFDHYRVSASGDVSVATDREALGATDQQAQSLPGGGIVITGTARNNSDQTVSSPLAIVALYDDTGDVVD